VEFVRTSIDRDLNGACIGASVEWFDHGELLRTAWREFGPFDDNDDLVDWLDETTRRLWPPSRLIADT
jgi:hypothetical protein